MAQTHLPPQWQQRTLAVLNSHGWDVGEFAHESIRLLTAWQEAEGGEAQWNPLNSTQYYTGSTTYNSFVINGVTYHVWNYPKATVGVCMTALTILNGNYNGIAGFLQSPQITAEEAVNKYKSQFQTWGTNPQTILDCLKTVA